MFNFNELKEDEASSALHEKQTSTGTEEHQKKNNNHVHMRRLPHIAHVLLDSSVSVEYPDWIKGGLWGREDSLRKKTKTEDWGHTGKNWELKLILIFPPDVRILHQKEKSQN